MNNFIIAGKFFFSIIWWEECVFSFLTMRQDRLVDVWLFIPDSN
jgi:hypothetical protein